MSNVTTKPDASKSPSNNARSNSGSSGKDQQSGVMASDFEQMLDDVTSAVVTYSKRQPKAIACGIFALGFLIGWKIKPW